MRKNVMRELEPSGALMSKRSVVIGGVVAIAVVLAGAGLWWSQRSSFDPLATIPLRPLSEGDIDNWLEAHHSKSDKTELSATLRAGDSIDALIAEIKSNEDVFDYLEKLSQRRNIQSWQHGASRAMAPMNAEQTARVIAQKPEMPLYSLEAALFALSVLRQLNKNAMLVQVFSFQPASAPLEPSGRMGYFVAGVVKDGKLSKVVDLLTPRHGLPEQGQFEIHNDIAAIAQLTNLRALYQLQKQDKPQKALSLSEQALSMCGECVNLLVSRAAIALANGDMRWKEYLEAAVTRRKDAPRMIALATALASAGEFESALSVINQAIEQMPDYAGAHATLAAVLLELGESDQALPEIELATRLSPQWEGLPLVWSQYYLQKGMSEQALKQAMSALTKNYYDWHTRLQLVEILRRAGAPVQQIRDYAEALLEDSSSDRRAQRRMIVEKVLGENILQSGSEDNHTEDTTESQAATQLDSQAYTGDNAPRLLDRDFSLGGDKKRSGFQLKKGLEY